MNSNYYKQLKSSASRSALMPCPFCGGEAELCRTNDNHMRPFVRCKFGSLLEPKCPMSHYVSWDYKTEQEAIESWNKRS